MKKHIIFLFVFALLASASTFLNGCGGAQRYASLQDFMEDNRSGGADYTLKEIIAYAEAVKMIRLAEENALKMMGMLGAMPPQRLLRLPGYSYKCLIDNSLSHDMLQVKIYRPDMDITESYDVGPGVAMEIALPVGDYEVTRYDSENRAWTDDVSVGSLSSKSSYLLADCKIIKLKENSLTENQPIEILGQDWVEPYAKVIKGWDQTF